MLFSGSDWDFKTLSRAYEAIEAIAIEELHLDIYPVQMEIISSQQMLDAYSSVGMPLMYRHWSFGKHFLYQELLYRKGGRGLAYELVINSNPCIVYLMEENTMALQALVTAHAALGHNHFFKNNHLFRQWTDASAILSYLDFAKGYIARCEERHGVAAVEAILDAAHALMEQGVFRYRRPPKLSSERQREGFVSAWSTKSALTTICGARCRVRRTGPRPAERTSASRSERKRSSCLRRTCFTSWKKTAWSWSPGSVKSSGSSASSRNTSIRSGKRR